MNIIISGRNVDLTEALNNAVREKLKKLDKYFTPDTNVKVTLTIEGGRQTAEVTIPVKGAIIRAEQTGHDMYTSIDKAEKAIETQLRKYRNKIIDRHQGAGNFQKTFTARRSTAEAAKKEINIAKTKRFDMKPMYPEDACLQMELLGHSFFVFSNADTGEVNVVYKRKGSSYGLIELND